MAVDPNNLDSPTPSTAPDGLFTAEEVWNEIGWPTDTPQAQSYTPIPAIEATIQRVLRGYEDQAIAEIEQSSNRERFARVSEEQSLSVSAGSGPTGALGVATVPNDSLPYFFGKIVAEDGTPLAPTSDINQVAETAVSDWTDYRYERAGRDVLVLPKDLASIAVWLVPQADAIETVLDGIVPQINQEILEAARQALELRTQESERIEQEALREVG